MLVAIALWGDGEISPVRTPDAVGAAANSGSVDGKTQERRMYVQLYQPVEPSEPLADLTPALLDSNVRQAMLQVTGPDSLPAPPLQLDQEGQAAESSDAELVARTRMAGLYESQIRARIERAWAAPAGEGRAASFSCRVQIRQSQDGLIKEVEIDAERCAASGTWQQSLVTAIFTASPLPAPPHPSVFVDRFSLLFDASALTRRPETVVIAQSR